MGTLEKSPIKANVRNVFACAVIALLSYSIIHLIHYFYTQKAHQYYYLGGYTGLVSLKDKTKIFVDTRDNLIAMYLIEDGWWENREIKLVTSMLKENDRVIEIGANYGTYLTRIVRKLRGLSSKKSLSPDQIYAFEANPRIFYLLNKTLALNNMVINLFNSPVFSVSGKDISFVVDEINAGHGRILDKNQEKSGREQDLSRVFSAKTVALDYVLKDNRRFDFIRMDAEGSELEILKGAQKIIENSPTIIIYAEWSPQMMSVHTDVAKELQHYLDSGFIFYKVKNGKLYSISKEELLNPVDFQNVVFSRRKL